MDSFLNEIGNKIKKLRKRAKLSQRQLAKIVNIPQGHLSRIENGQVNLSAYSLFQIIRVLEFDLMFVPRQEILSVKALLRLKKDAS